MSRMRIVNLGNAVCLLTTSILMMIQANLYIGFQLGILAVNFYLCAGGCALCCFELRVNTFLIPMRRNCGFLFTYTGRLLMLVVLGTFQLSMAMSLNSAGWGVLYGIVAAVTLLNAVFNGCVIYRHPGINSQGDIRRSEGAFAKGADSYATSAATNYVANNPDLVDKAVEHGVQYAKENPEQAAKVASSAMSSGGGYGSGGAGNPFGGGEVANAW